MSRPRNVFTNLQSTVVTTFFKPWKHIDDPYERARQLEIEIMKQAKTMEKESAFRPNSF